MTANGDDPYRVLGVRLDATDAEIHRAYRALVKRHHPDAGNGSVARFLEVQAAYESLFDAGGRLAPRDDTPSGGRRRPRGPSPSTADRPAGRGQPQHAAGSADWGRRRTTTRPGSHETPGSQAGSAGGPQRGADREWGRGAGGAPPGGRPPGRRRATLGSTSYDDAEGVEPSWEGASWYGQSSSTYWTVNPKEYADPRKHGPEYQARARREAASTGASVRLEMDEQAPDPEPARDAEPRRDDDARRTRRGSARPGPA